LNSNAEDLIEPLLRAVAKAPRSLLMLDYDGTLAPFHKHRDQAFSYPGISALLQEIVGTGRTRVAIVSGRDVGEIIPLLNFKPYPEIWGLHGSQRQWPDGSFHLVPINEMTVQGLAKANQWLRQQNLQHTAEFKNGSIAVHWRGLSETQAREIRSRVLLGWTSLAKQAEMNLLEFDGGVEIRAHNPNKGDAVRIILSEMSSGTPAAYLGDDITDEHAFEALNTYPRKGETLSVLVRPHLRQTAAQLWLRPPNEVLALLQRWFEAVQGKWKTETGRLALSNRGDETVIGR
jgi:trehalose 6-phosphate phosphatase